MGIVIEETAVHGESVMVDRLEDRVVISLGANTGTGWYTTLTANESFALVDAVQDTLDKINAEASCQCECNH